MEQSMDVLVSALEDEILNVTETDADEYGGQEVDHEEVVDIENDFCINIENFKPVKINHTPATRKSSKPKWVPVEDLMKIKTNKHEADSKVDKKLPLVALRREKTIDNVIKPSQVRNTGNQNSNDEITETQPKPTTTLTEPKVTIFGIKNVVKPIIIETPKTVPVKVKVIEKKEINVKDTNKESELELQVKLLKDLLGDALSKIPKGENPDRKTTEHCKEETKGTADVPDVQPKRIETQLILDEKVPEKQPNESSQRRKIAENCNKTLDKTDVSETEINGTLSSTIDKQNRMTDDQPNITEKLAILKYLLTDALSKNPKEATPNLETTEDSVSIPENQTTRPELTEKLKDLLKDFFNTAHTNNATDSSSKRKITVNSDEKSKNTDLLPEKQPKMTEKQPIIIKNLPEITKNPGCRTKCYFYEVTEKQPKVIEVQPKITENPFKMTDNGGECYFYEVTDKQLKLIENGLKITDAQPILTENPPTITENLKVKELEELLKPKQEIAEYCVEKTRDKNSDKLSKIADNPFKITESSRVYSEAPTVAIMADKNIVQPPMIKLKVGSLIKIDYKQLQNMTETNIIKYIANAIPETAKTNLVQNINLPVKEKPKLPAKQPQITLKSPIKTTFKHKIYPNGRSTVNTPSVNIIAKEIVRDYNITLAYTNTKSSVPVVFNVRNAKEHDERIKPTEFNTNQIIDTFENEILGHTEIVNENEHINIRDALEPTAEVTIKQEVQMVDIKHDPLDTGVQETNEDSVQVVDITDPLFIDLSDDPLNMAQKQQRIKHKVFKIKSKKQVKRSIPMNLNQSQIVPKYCKICQKVFSTEDGLKNHKHTENFRCKCEREFSSQKSLEDHKLKEHNLKIPVQAKPKTAPQKQKKEICKKCNIVFCSNAAFNVHNHNAFKCCGKQFCTRISLETHKLKDHPKERGIGNQNSKSDKKHNVPNYVKPINAVKATKDTNEVMEDDTITLDAQEESDLEAYDEEIEKTRIKKQNIKQTSINTLSLKEQKVETSKDKPKTEISLEKRKELLGVVQCKICQKPYLNLDSLYFHINIAHDAGWQRYYKIDKSTEYIPKKHTEKRHLIQKTALFECEICKCNFARYSPDHYELCKQNMTMNRFNECKECNKRLPIGDVTHKFLHHLGYKPKTIPLNSTRLSIVSECPICRFHFILIQSTTFLIHTKICTGKRYTYYKCCGFIFNDLHYKLHNKNHSAPNIVLTYDLLIRTSPEEFYSDEGSLKTIHELKLLPTANSKIIYAYGNKYRVVQAKDFNNIQPKMYQCRVCRFNATSQTRLAQHEFKHVTDRRKRELSLRAP